MTIERPRQCNVCGGTQFFRNGKLEGRQRWQCRQCGKRSILHIGSSLANSKLQKIMPLVYEIDIETTPVETFTWGVGKRLITHKNIKNDFSIICWSAKQLFGNQMISYCQTPKEITKRDNRTIGDDKRILAPLFRLMDKADVLIAHNGQNFDFRKINARFAVNRFDKPLPYQNIDTYKSGKKALGFTSHSLDYLGKLMVNKEKIQTNYELWLRCINGDRQALYDMDIYCQHDVMLLEEVYLELRQWIYGHPNLSVYAETAKSECHVCLSKNLDWKGTYATPAGRYAAFRCKECGAIGRSRYNDYEKYAKKTLIRSTAR